jgi:hypothetical protein
VEPMSFRSTIGSGSNPSATSTERPGTERSRRPRTADDPEHGVEWPRGRSPGLRITRRSRPRPRPSRRRGPSQDHRLVSSGRARVARNRPILLSGRRHGRGQGTSRSRDPCSRRPASGPRCQGRWRRRIRRRHRLSCPHLGSLPIASARPDGGSSGQGPDRGTSRPVWSLVVIPRPMADPNLPLGRRDSGQPGLW